ncbi:MAG: helix-turn-helix domain-containing protein [Nannocystaceae bacterium]
MPRAKSRARTSTRTRAKPAGRHATTEPCHTPPQDVSGRSRATPKEPRRFQLSATALPRFLTVDETAELLRTTRRAIYARIQRGDFPGVVRISRRLLIDAGALLQWVDERRGPSPKLEGDKR